MRRTERAALLGALLLTAGLLFAISGYAPWISPDTGGYIDPPPPPEAWARPRHPAFGWLLAGLPGPGFALLPVLQVALFFGAIALLHGALRGYGVSVRAAAAVTASALLSNLLLLWHNAVHPEFPSCVLAIAALAFAVRLAAGRRFAPNAAALVLTLSGAYILRPTFLPAILLVPLLYAALARLRAEAGIMARTALLVVACAAPFLLNAAVRLQAVGDFNIVSFGGFQMSGMAGLMLTPEILARLPEDVRPLGQAILDGREAAERRGDVLATPTNSRGERSFTSAALGYYDLYARTYDSLLYGTIAPLQGAEPWVAWNARLMRLSLATVRAAPDRYAAWVVGGTARVVGRAVVTNLALVLALAGLAVLYPLALALGRLPLAAPRLPGAVAAPPDVPVLLCLTALYSISAGTLTVVTTFPAARYIDTAALFLPALPIYGLLTVAAGLASSRPRSPPR